MQQRVTGVDSASAEPAQDASSTSTSAPVQSAGNAALSRILADPRVVAAKQPTGTSTTKVPLTPGLLAQMNVDVGGQGGRRSKHKKAHGHPAQAPQAVSTDGQPLPNLDGAPFAHVIGTPFVEEHAGEGDISPLDITQGILGDCWLLSAMAAIARENPEAIRKLIKTNGDGTYDVTLYIPTGDGNAKQAKVYRVDSSVPVLPGFANTAIDAQPGNARGNEQFPIDGMGSEPIELWPMLLEKAVAMAEGAGGYKAMEGGDVGLGMDLLSAGKVTDVDMSKQAPAVTLAAFAAALQAKQPVTAVTMPKFPPELLARVDELKIVDWHVYSVKSVDVGKQTLSLQNPWGRQDLDDLSLDDFYKFYTWYSVGPKP